VIVAAVRGLTFAELDFWPEFSRLGLTWKLCKVMQVGPCFVKLVPLLLYKNGVRAALSKAK
jgi:hypothetical protein